MTWQSDLLATCGVRHAFSTRHGGVSNGPYTTLNLGNPTGMDLAHLDSADHITRNWERFAAAIDCSHCRVAHVRQVHGCQCVELDQTYRGDDPPVDADALTTAAPGLLLAVRVADCVPLLLANNAGSVVAAVHAGWRGVVAGVVMKTLEQLDRRHRVTPDQLLAAIGPAISARHYEVGPEVADAFHHVGLAEAVQQEFCPRPHVDLTGAVRGQLLRAGVRHESIDTADLCTFRDADDFFSHRRHAGRTGRLAAVITPACSAR